MGNSKGTFLTASGCGILVKKTDRMINNKTNQPQMYFSLALISGYSDDVVTLNCSAYGERICKTVELLKLGSEITFVGIGSVYANDYKDKHYANLQIAVKEIPAYKQGNGNTGIDLERKCVIDKGNANYQPSRNSATSDDETPF